MLFIHQIKSHTKQTNLIQMSKSEENQIES